MLSTPSFEGYDLFPKPDDAYPYLKPRITAPVSTSPPPIH